MQEQTSVSWQILSRIRSIADVEKEKKIVEFLNTYARSTTKKNEKKIYFISTKP